MHEFVVGNCGSGKTRYASEVLTARVEHGHYPVLVSRYPREWNGMGTSSLAQDTLVKQEPDSEVA